MVYSNGSRYDGEWRDQKKHGEGILTMANGDTFIGKWLENTEHGSGVFVAASGAKERREYKDGQIIHRHPL